MEKEGITRQCKRWILAKVRLFPDFVRGIDYSSELLWDDSLMEEHSRYSMSTGKLCRTVKGYLNDKDISDDSVIDIGCGKGKMLEFFGKFSNRQGIRFKHVAGVDFSQELCEIAEKNMRKVGVCCNIYCSDAAEFDGYANYTYFYMFNPMKGELLRKTMRKVKQSVVEKPRKIHIIYCNPWSQNILLDEGFRIEEKLKDYAIVFTAE